MLIHIDSSNGRAKRTYDDSWRQLIATKTKTRGGKSSTDCKCPKCGSRHQALIEWTGRGTPRIYCSACRPLVAAIDSMSNHDGTGSGSRRRHGYTGHTSE